MKPSDRAEGERVEMARRSFAKEDRPLPGIESAARRRTFIEQVLESIRRIKFIALLRERGVSPRRANPADLLFDPLKAAIVHQRQGNPEEAFWLLFLYVHFGKHNKAGWRYARDIYGRLGGGRWDWPTVSSDVPAFRIWLTECQADLMNGKPRGFGNHRKRESLAGVGDKGTGAAVESYVQWVDPPRTHQDMMAEALLGADGDPCVAFDSLYRSMEAVRLRTSLAKPADAMLPDIAGNKFHAAHPAMTVMPKVSNSPMPARTARSTTRLTGSEIVNCVDSARPSGKLMCVVACVFTPEPASMMTKVERTIHINRSTFLPVRGSKRAW